MLGAHLHSARPNERISSVGRVDSVPLVCLSLFVYLRAWTKKEYPFKFPSELLKLIIEHCHFVRFQMTFRNGSMKTVFVEKYFGAA